MLCDINVIIIYTQHFVKKEGCKKHNASIFGAELKNGHGLCVNYFKRRDLYEKKIILTNLSSEKCFLICKRMPVTFIFPSLTNEQVFVPVAFC